MTATHDVTLTYTTDDDGVYIVCSCGYHFNLGQNAAPSEAVAAQLDHVLGSALRAAADGWQARIEERRARDGK